MEFLLIYYALTYLFLAGCGYVCFSVVAGLDALGKRIFAAVLAFGACSLAGYVAINVAMALFHLKLDQDGRTERTIIVLAYVVSGLIGSWFSLRIFKPAKSSR
ncbi:MAG TPA: hypothetical protein VMU48_03370 [Terracidiphilus sp.]|nr:hypothetical protein [Terracidiphilus sp.]